MSACLISFRRLVATAHLYNQPKWTDEKNRMQFGKCFSEYGHGHNYEIDFSWQVSNISPDIYREFLEAAERTMDSVCALYDHKHLSFTHPVFQVGGEVSTTENLAKQVWHEFQSAFHNNATSRLVPLALPSGVLVWEMSDLASSFGVHPENALVQLNHGQKSYVKQKRKAYTSRMGSAGRPVSLMIQMSGDKIQNNDELNILIDQNARLAETLPNLAQKLAKHLDSPILLRDQKNHCAFCAP